MPSPVGIDYDRLTLSNILFQQDVGDAVDYPPILAGGHGWEASLIAFDGPGIGNGTIYAACFVLLRRTAAMFLFWLAVMSAATCGATPPCAP